MRSQSSILPSLYVGKQHHRNFSTYPRSQRLYQLLFSCFLAHTFFILLCELRSPQASFLLCLPTGSPGGEQQGCKRQQGLVLVTKDCLNQVPHTGQLNTTEKQSLSQKSELKVSAGPTLNEGSRRQSVPCLSLGFSYCRQSLACLGLYMHHPVSVSITAWPSSHGILFVCV